MKKITLKEVKKRLKKIESTFMVGIEEDDCKKFYRKLKWLSYGDAISELDSFESEGETTIDVYCIVDKNDDVKFKNALEAFEKMGDEIEGHGFDFVNSDLQKDSESLFLTYRSHEALEASREKKVEKYFIDPVVNIIGKYSEFFECRVD